MYLSDLLVINDYLPELDNVKYRDTLQNCTLREMNFPIWYNVALCSIFVWRRTSAKQRYKKAKIRKRRNQRKIPTPKTEVGKNQSNNQVLIP